MLPIKEELDDQDGAVVFHRRSKNHPRLETFNLRRLSHTGDQLFEEFLLSLGEAHSTDRRRISTELVAPAARLETLSMEEGWNSHERGLLMQALASLCGYQRITLGNHITKFRNSRSVMSQQFTAPASAGSRPAERAHLVLSRVTYTSDVRPPSLDSRDPGSIQDLPEVSTSRAHPSHKAEDGSSSTLFLGSVLLRNDPPSLSAPTIPSTNVASYAVKSSTRTDLLSTGRMAFAAALSDGSSAVERAVDQGNSHFTRNVTPKKEVEVNEPAAHDPRLLPVELTDHTTNCLLPTESLPPLPTPVMPILPLPVPSKEKGSHENARTSSTSTGTTLPVLNFSNTVSSASSSSHGGFHPHDSRGSLGSDNGYLRAPAKKTNGKSNQKTMPPVHKSRSQKIRSEAVIPMHTKKDQDVDQYMSRWAKGNTSARTRGLLSTPSGAEYAQRERSPSVDRFSPTPISSKRTTDSGTVKKSTMDCDDKEDKDRKNDVVNAHKVDSTPAAPMAGLHSPVPVSPQADLHAPLRRRWSSRRPCCNLSSFAAISKGDYAPSEDTSSRSTLNASAAFKTPAKKRAAAISVKSSTSRAAKKAKWPREP